MRALSHLFYKVTLSSMILAAPAITTGSNTDANYGTTIGNEAAISYFSSNVIKRFINYTSLVFSPVYSAHEEFVNAAKTAIADKPLTSARLAGAIIRSVKSDKPAGAVKLAAVRSGIGSTATVASPATARAAANKAIVTNSATLSSVTGLSITDKMMARRVELAMVINQALLLYDHMNLQRSGLDEKAFEYAWRGYHNLVKKGLIRRKNVLSICDFSQSSRNRRLYVIDIRHKRLLYRTYVAHGQNSGAEFASSFSNQPDSYKSSLGFYVTTRTYYGKNGLSLKIEGLDTGYNDLAGKRNIVLHGCSYVGTKYLSHYGNLGTSLGCPAIPSSMSPRIIQLVKHGSCLFIYHPTQEYLDGSSVINSDI
jgi:L,D-transpeptidase catalytic domain